MCRVFDLGNRIIGSRLSRFIYFEITAAAIRSFSMIYKYSILSVYRITFFGSLGNACSINTNETYLYTCKITGLGSIG